jgi:hypothetical protein
MVTVHAVDASLRKVLSMAIADAPYSATMQYTNLQDSFPASVVISRYQVSAQQLGGKQQHDPKQLTAAAAPMMAPQPAVVEEEPERPDMAAMQPEEQLAYFMRQPTEEQVSIIFDMEPTAQELALMEQLMAKEELSSEVKMEMLDSLSTGEYESSAPAIKHALNAADPEVATKAVETLAELGSAKDIPALKELAEKTSDESVQTAVTDAIETLRE